MVDLDLIEEGRSSLIPLLDRGVIDLAIMLGDPTYQEFAHMCLWSERVMVALPSTHPLAVRDFVYWTDLKNERFLVSRRDPGPELEDILITKLASPGDRPSINQVTVHHDHLLSLVGRKRGILLTCESSIGNERDNIVFREVRDGNGPAHLGFVAYWRRNNDNPTLKQLLLLLQAHLAVPLRSNA